MNRTQLRNAVMLAVAAASASLEAPRLSKQPLSGAAAELLGAPAALAGAVQTVAANVDSGSHLGFDTNIYPGDAAMAAWRESKTYEWVGYYLPAPCHKDDSWSGEREHLVKNGWGLAVIYVGQQTWGNTFTTAASSTKARKSHTAKRSRKTRRHSTHTMTRRSKKPVAAGGADCSASLVNAARGAIDARDAIAKATREGFPTGTVLFLDVEHMDVLPQPMRDYYRAWIRTLLADGTYRPGIYAHTSNAARIYDDVSDEYDQAGRSDDPPFWIAGSSGFSIESAPTEVGHAFASAWQGMLDVVRTHNGVKLPIDISVASDASPSMAAVQ